MVRVPLCPDTLVDGRSSGRDADASAWSTSPCSARSASERWSMWRFGLGALQRFDSCYGWLAGCLRPKDI